MPIDRGGPYRERPTKHREVPRSYGHDIFIVVALLLSIASIEHWSAAIDGFASAMGFPRVR